MTHTQAALVVLTAAGLYASWSDWRHRKLPNWLAAIVAALGLAAAIRFGDFDFAVSTGFHALMALCVGIILFATGVIGGGDGKYYAAAATWFPLAKGFALLGWVSLAGLVLVAGWFTSRRLRGIKLEFRPQPDSAKLPYGLAIAAGSVIAAAWPLL